MMAEIVSNEVQGVASVDSDRSSWEISLEKEIDQMISTGNIVALKKLTIKLKGFRKAVKLKREMAIAQQRSVTLMDIPSNYVHTLSH